MAPPNFALELTRGPFAGAAESNFTAARRMRPARGGPRATQRRTLGVTSMRWGDQAPIYGRGELSWGIGDDPWRTFSVHGEVFTNYFPVEKYRNPREIERVAVTGVNLEGQAFVFRPQGTREANANGASSVRTIAGVFDSR